MNNQEFLDVSLSEESNKAVNALGIDLYISCIRIQNLNLLIESIVQIISDLSWIEELDIIAKVCFKANANKTIKKIIKSLKDNTDNNVTVEVGEYAISLSAQEALNQKYNHIVVPVAELWKEKISGNPGFDFHTEDFKNVITFGEAKYSGSINPYGKAITQIIDFIEKEKDMAELVQLKELISETATNNAVDGNKAYAAAFSVNSDDYDAIIANAIKYCCEKGISNIKELYLVGVIIDV